MRTRLTVVAVAVLLTVGTGSVVAATTDAPTTGAPTTDVPTTDAPTTGALPADYTVEVLDGSPSDEELHRALETAWANEDVRRHFDDGAAIHFEVWTSELDGSIHVQVAPIETPDETRVIVELDPERRTVTSIDEPVTLDASDAITIDGSEFDIDDTNARAAVATENATSDGNATRLTADRARQFQVNGSTIERGSGGTFTVDVEDDGTA